MWVKLKTILIFLAASFWLGVSASTSLADDLSKFVEQAVRTCEDVAVRRVPLNSLNWSHWRSTRNDQQDHGEAGKQISFDLIHTNVPWLTLNVSESGIGSTNGVSRLSCSLKYNGQRHSFDGEKRLDWLSLEPEVITKEFSEQLDGLISRLIAEKFDPPEESFSAVGKEILLKKCESGIRFKASLALLDPEDSRGVGFFLIESANWNRPC